VASERRRTLRRDRHEFGAHTDELAMSTGSAPTNCDRDEIERVMCRLAELPEDQRLAIHAFYFEGKNANQAAVQLELSRSGFYALLQRALARLATRPNRTAIETRSNE
jgi:DNA-directed RNA polymerase specialized sigma24 family protein